MKKYKWIERLINKVTNNKTPNNTTFQFYGHEIVLQSSTPDFTRVIVNGQDKGGITKNIMDFSLDFLTKKCTANYMQIPEFLDSVKSGLNNAYQENWFIDCQIFK